MRNRAAFWIALTAWLSCAPARAADDPALVGHWPLAADARDVSGHGHHGRAVDIAFGAVGGPGRAGAASFDGIGSHIVIPASPDLRLGRSDFTLTLWAETERAHNDLAGDLASQYDPTLRRGFQWGIKDGPGTTTSQANDRNLQFGLDAGTTPVWTDRGRPGQAVYIMAMAVHAGQLYVGTCEPGAGQTGHVYRHDGGTRWVDCGPLDSSNAVTALAAHEGTLYAGTGKYRLAGSSLAESANPNAGGGVFRLGHDGRWSRCGQLSGVEAVGGLVSFQGKLHASSLYRPAGFFRYEGDTRWSPEPLPADGRRVVALGVFNGKLYATSYDACSVDRFDGTSWEPLGRLEATGQTYSFEVHEGRLFVGTWPNGRVFRHDGGSRWLDAGRLGDEKEVMGMAVYNGRLHAGTLPLAEVYRLDAGTTWTSTGQLDRTPDVRYRRAWTMALYQGQLFCGTLPSGHVYSMRVGQAVSHDHALPSGWHHLAASRRGGELRLFVDGQVVATSTAERNVPLELATEAPLYLGRGAHDFFRGRMRDVRLYRRALEPAEAATLAKRERDDR